MYNEALESLKGNENVIAAAIISQDGTLMASYCPGDNCTGMTEAFPMMCATVLGAAMTANSELKIGEMDDIMITSDEGTTMIKRAGEHLILVVTMAKSGDMAIIGQVLDALEE